MKNLFLFIFFFNLTFSTKTTEAAIPIQENSIVNNSNDKIITSKTIFIHPNEKNTFAWLSLISGSLFVSGIILVAISSLSILFLPLTVLYLPAIIFGIISLIKKERFTLMALFGILSGLIVLFIMLASAS